MACKTITKDNKVLGIGTGIAPDSKQYTIPKPDSTAGLADSITSVNGATSVQLQNKKVVLPKIQLVVGGQVSALGKKKVLINKQIFGPPKDLRGNGVAISSAGTSIDDFFRLYAGFYWTLGPGNVLETYKTQADKSIPFTIKSFNYLDKGQVTLSDILISDKAVSKVFATQQWVVIAANKQQFLYKKSVPTNKSVMIGGEVTAVVNNSPLQTAQTTAFDTGQYEFSAEQWKAYVMGGIIKENEQVPALVPEGQFFYDYSFDLPTPFTKKELELFTGFTRPLYSNADGVYNFLVKSYENQIKVMPEVALPNLYFLEAYFNGASMDDRLERQVTLNGKIDHKDITINTSGQKEIQRKIAGQYFDKYAYASQDYAGVSNAEVIKSIGNEFNNVVIPYYNVALLDSIAKKKELVPMYVDMEFSSDRTTQLAEVLNESGFSSKLSKQIAKDGKLKKSSTLEFVEATEVATVSEKVFKKQQSFDSPSYRTWDITDMINNPDNTTNKNLVYTLGENISETSKNTSFIDSLMKIIANGKLKKIIKDKFRTYEEMVSGKQAYSETVLYKIEKYKSDNQGRVVGPIIQNIFLENSNAVDVIHYVDTQVKYNTDYVYKVYAFQAVIGTKYSYDNLETDFAVGKESGGAAAWFRVTQLPSVILVEIPYFEMTTKIMDSPPVAPDINIVSYRAIKNRLLLLFNGSIGEYEIDPVIIYPEEMEIINEIKRVQRLSNDDKVRYKSDDGASLFQVFRLDRPPRNYFDFAESLIAAVQTDVSTATEQAASSAAFIDEIENNKKYWYCFRAIDDHGHFSFPTCVYQVELKEDGGIVFPEINVYDFKEFAQTQPTRPVKKYIQISPAFVQTLINEAKTGIEDSTSVKNVKQVQLGVRDQTVWGKTFKIRLTSKNSGKIIDLNVGFTNKTVRLPKKID